MDMTFKKYQTEMQPPKTADFTLIRFSRNSSGEHHEFRLSTFVEQMKAAGLEGAALQPNKFTDLNAQQIAALLKRNGFETETVELMRDYRAAWLDYQNESREKAILFCRDLMTGLALYKLPKNIGAEICNKAWRDHRDSGHQSVFDAAKEAASLALSFHTANRQRTTGSEMSIA